MVHSVARRLLYFGIVGLAVFLVFSGNGCVAAPDRDEIIFEDSYSNFEESPDPPFSIGTRFTDDRSLMCPQGQVPAHDGTCRDNENGARRQKMKRRPRKRGWPGTGR